MIRSVCIRHNYAVERGLVVGFYGQPVLCIQPYYQTTRFRSSSSYVVSLSLSLSLCSTVSGQAKAHAVQICTNVVLPNHLPVIVASDRP